MGIGTFQECVIAFQNLSARLYALALMRPTGPAKVFQRVDEGSNLWRDTIGHGYDAWLTGTELQVEQLMDVKELRREGGSIWEITRVTGPARNTVRKVPRGEHALR